ncbi:MAG: EAL domain-containing protein [Betaproteobacteria bacterium]|nr:EAL domain-containing protein [Betaproteobacteria bacterium]MDE2353939.1 EAL domain-containing protein [Betaproteobacteria bacterium]
MNQGTLKSSLELLPLVTEMAGIAVWEYDFVAGHMLRSENHDKLYGLPWQARWTADIFYNATHPDDLPHAQACIQASMAPGGPDDYAFDFRVKWPDGSLHWLWVKGRIVRRTESGEGTMIRGVLIDITPRKEAEARVQRLTQLYAALSQCNQAIVRCTSEEELFPQICRDAVKFGGMKMAWVGLIQPDLKVKPVASYGEGTEYLEAIEISADHTDSYSHGPTGIAILENHPVWCQNFMQDPLTAHRHELGRRYGWGAQASLPLHRSESVVGAIVFYAPEPQAFDEVAQNLLIEMAMDISFALDHFTLERERENALVALRSSERMLRTIIETEPECVKILDQKGHLLHMNAAGMAMLEVGNLEELQQYALTDFVIPEHQEAFKLLHERVMEGETGFLEFEIVGRNGTRRWLETHAAPMPSTSGEYFYLLGITRDITERKHSEERIRYLANYDALTGLPNRTQLDSHLSFALNLAKRNSGRFAVMFLDLDRFKDVNDTYGHRLGDHLLVEIANRLRDMLRAEDTVSRFGGDEFILMFPDCDAFGAAQIARKLLTVINQSCKVEQYELTVSASMGIALYPEDGEDMDTLFRNADTAMYRAKKSGRNRFSFFTPEMQLQVARNLQLVNSLYRALENGELDLHYQPQISLVDGRLTGAEVLLRWNHPEQGSISPAEFIPVAEDSGLIIPIGEWVLRTAAARLLSRIEAGHVPFPLSVNLSGVQFRHAGLPALLSRILEETGLPPEYLELELTESVMMNDPEGETATIESLHALGVRVSIDDFGTGYSSLSYLKRFKVEKLKIDQSFIRDISTDNEDRAIVSAIISMAKSLGMKTIAEGVETAEQLGFLKEQECDEVQGYYFSKPIPWENFMNYLKDSGCS